MKVNHPNIGQLFSLSRDPVICEQDGIVTDMNPSAVTLFKGDITGKSLSTFIPDTVLSVEADSFIAAATIAGQNATIVQTSYGEYRLYSFILPRVPCEETFDLPVSVTMRDITNTIKVTTEQIMLLSEKYNDTKLDRYSAILKHNVSKLKRLMSNHTLLTACMNGTQPFHPVTISINELCSSLVDAVADLAEARDIQVEFFPETEVISSVDPQLLRIMLLNLISNSLLHTQSGGKIQIGLKATNTLISITVADTGSGIQPEDLSTIFSRRNEPVRMDSGRADAGLGLGVADYIAKFHNGTIVVQSTPGKGTIIAAHLKRTQDQSLMQPSTEYRVSLSDTVMTELSTWLTWQDYLMVFDD